MTRSRTDRVRRHGGVLGVGALAGLVVMAGCGSTTKVAAKVTLPTPASSSRSGVNGSVSAASAFARKYLNPPAGIPVTAKLAKAPSRGKTIVYLQCEVPQCQELGSGVRAAAQSIGWQGKTISWKSVDPATLVAAMQQALEMKPAPAYVVFSGLPEAVWSSKVAQFQKAGIKLIAAVLGPATVDGTVVANLLDNSDAQLQGRILADFVISDSGGTAKVLQQDLPDFPTIAAVGTGIRDELKASCSGCSVTSLNVTAAQVATGGVTPAIVSALQRDRSIDYIAASDIALAPGLPAALKAAGLGKVKIVGGAADTTDVASLHTGTGTAFMANNLNYVGWLAVDVAVRQEAGMSFAPNDGGMPQQLLTKDNVDAAGSPGDFPAGYQAAFKKLWRVG